MHVKAEPRRVNRLGFIALWKVGHKWAFGRHGLHKCRTSTPSNVSPRTSRIASARPAPARAHVRFILHYQACLSQRRWLKHVLHFVDDFKPWCIALQVSHLIYDDRIRRELVSLCGQSRRGRSSESLRRVVLIWLGDIVDDIVASQIAHGCLLSACNSHALHVVKRLDLVVAVLHSLVRRVHHRLQV